MEHLAGRFLRVFLTHAAFQMVSHAEVWTRYAPLLNFFRPHLKSRNINKDRLPSPPLNAHCLAHVLILRLMSVVFPDQARFTVVLEDKRGLVSSCPDP